MRVFNRGPPVRSSQCRLSGGSHLVPWWLWPSGESMEPLPLQGWSEQRQSETWSHFWSGRTVHINSISDADFSRWSVSRAQWETPPLLPTGIATGSKPWVSFVLLSLLLLIADRFYIGLFSSLEQTHCTVLCWQFTRVVVYFGVGRRSWGAWSSGGWAASLVQWWRWIHSPVCRDFSPGVDFQCRQSNGVWAFQCETGLFLPELTFNAI